MNSIRPGSASALLFAVGLFLTFAAKLSAQALVEACYVEKTGVMYRIDPQGVLPGDLPTECEKPGKHIKFDWNAQGPQGAPGQDGVDGVSGYSTHFELGFFDSSSPKTVEVSCPAGKVVTGGGANVSPEFDIPPVAITRSFGLTNPIAGLPRWVATAQEITPIETSWRLVAIVHCAEIADANE